MNEQGYICRPPFGFIVEGDGEYHSYPSIVCRITESCGYKIPIINAGGYGGIINHLDEHLRDLIISSKPFSILITLDLLDVVKDEIVESCELLKKQIEKSIDEFIIKGKTDARLHPLPDYISVVIQIQKFESWIVADKEGLVNSGFVEDVDLSVECSNVDEEIQNPYSWLLKYSNGRLKIKNPKICKKVISSINLDDVASKSKSFNKFSREITKIYGNWQTLCQNDS